MHIYVWTFEQEDFEDEDIELSEYLYLPYIEEVHLVDMDDELEQVHIYVLLVIRHWVNLKRILHPRSCYTNKKLIS